MFISSSYSEKSAIPASAVKAGEEGLVPAGGSWYRVPASGVPARLLDSALATGHMFVGDSSGEAKERHITGAVSYVEGQGFVFNNAVLSDAMQDALAGGGFSGINPENTTFVESQAYVNYNFNSSQKSQFVSEFNAIKTKVHAGNTKYTFNLTSGDNPYVFDNVTGDALLTTSGSNQVSIDIKGQALSAIAIQSLTVPVSAFGPGSTQLAATATIQGSEASQITIGSYLVISNLAENHAATALNTKVFSMFNGSWRITGVTPAAGDTYLVTFTVEKSYDHNSIESVYLPDTPGEFLTIAGGIGSVGAGVLNGASVRVIKTRIVFEQDSKYFLLASGSTSTVKLQDIVIERPTRETSATHAILLTNAAKILISGDVVIRGFAEGLLVTENSTCFGSSNDRLFVTEAVNGVRVVGSSDISTFKLILTKCSGNAIIVGDASSAHFNTAHIGFCNGSALVTSNSVLNFQFFFRHPTISAYVSTVVFNERSAYITESSFFADITQFNYINRTAVHILNNSVFGGRVSLVANSGRAIRAVGSSISLTGFNDEKSFVYRNGFNGVKPELDNRGVILESSFAFVDGMEVVGTNGINLVARNGSNVYGFTFASRDSGSGTLPAVYFLSSNGSFNTLTLENFRIGVAAVSGSNVTAWNLVADAPNAHTTGGVGVNNIGVYTAFGSFLRAQEINTVSPALFVLSANSMSSISTSSFAGITDKINATSYIHESDDGKVFINTGGTLTPWTE